MKTLDEILDDLAGKSYEELLFFGRNFLAETHKAITRVISDPQKCVLLELMLLAQPVAADGTFTPLEKQFIYDLLKIKPEDFFKFMTDAQGLMIDPAIRDKVVEFVSGLSPQEKNAVLGYVCVITAVDNHVDPKEVEFVQRILKA